MTDLLAALPSPTPSAVRAARDAAGQTQTEAAAAVGGTRDGWAKWEGGARGMPASSWALYLLATGQHPGAMLSETPCSGIFGI